MFIGLSIIEQMFSKCCFNKFIFFNIYMPDTLFLIFHFLRAIAHVD